MGPERFPLCFPYIFLLNLVSLVHSLQLLMSLPIPCCLCLITLFVTTVLNFFFLCYIYFAQFGFFLCCLLRSSLFNFTIYSTLSCKKSCGFSLSLSHSVSFLTCLFPPTSLTQSVSFPFLCIFSSLSVSQSVSFPVCLFLSLSLSQSHSFPLCFLLSLALSQSVSFSVWLFPSLSLSQSVSFPVCLFPVLLFSHSVSFPVFLFPICLFFQSVSFLSLSLFPSISFTVHLFPSLSLSPYVSFPVWLFSQSVSILVYLFSQSVSFLSLSLSQSVSFISLSLSLLVSISFHPSSPFLTMFDYIFLPYLRMSVTYTCVCVCVWGQKKVTLLCWHFNFGLKPLLNSPACLFALLEIIFYLFNGLDFEENMLMLFLYNLQEWLPVLAFKKRLMDMLRVCKSSEKHTILLRVSILMHTFLLFPLHLLRVFCCALCIHSPS